MSDDSKSEVLSGRLVQMLFSPKGGIEGMLLEVDGVPVQVSLRPDEMDGKTLARAVGKPIEVKASADHSPKARDGVHPVYKLISIKKLAGKAYKPSATAPGRVSGVVAAIHYAKHGEPNGVILESGEFIHTRPPGMKRLKLKVGSQVTARGEARMTVLGTSLIDAHVVNRVTLE